MPSRAAQQNVITVLVFSLLAAPCNASSKFLHNDGSVNRQAFRDEIANAMGSVLGCGGEADPEHISDVKAVIMPMWKTVSKTQNRVDRRTLRYLVHRYFMQTSSLMVRGFEPSRSTNETHWGSTDILSQMVPAYVESVLSSQHSTANGFTLQDVIDMVLTLDQLIFDSESALLEDIYKSQRKPTQSSLSYNGLKQVLHEYMVKWMVDADPDDHVRLLENRSLARQVLPHFDDLLAFAEGRIKTFQQSRQDKAVKKGGREAWNMRYSFEDAHKVVGGITRSFQSYWQSECASMKESLISMDKHGTGRVPLAKFYDTAINVDWRFGESEDYLRELGALDESSSWIGGQVIIPNYLQASSNCIVSTAHYNLCCVAECETLLGEIERAVQAPEALPGTILDLVGKMTSQTTLDQDEGPHLDGNMISQLEKVAKNYNGKVPLHSRLFAQWLHYAFPHECPFPHKAGTVSSATPEEFGNYIASSEDMQKHASNATALEVSVTKEELHWLSQWSEEEELLMDYQSEGRSGGWTMGFLLFSAVMAAMGLYTGVIGASNPKKTDTPFANGHSHFV